MANGSSSRWSPERGLRDRWLPWLLVAGALALATLALVHGLAAHQARRALLAQSDSLAAPLPGSVRARIAGDPDLDRARIAMARALVAQELSAEELKLRSTGDAEADLAMSLERLEMARGLAAEALVERPLAWEASMLLGSATYLSRALTRDPLLVQDWRAWDRPLSLSRDLAPGKDEPHRFSVLAYLELWPLLSQEKKDMARSLVARGLADRRTFGLLIGLWIQIAEGSDEVFAVTPQATFAWEFLTNHYRREGDWEAAITARERLDQALLAELTAELARAATACDEADVERCRRLYHGIVRAARPSQRFLPVVSEVLADSPAGPAGEADARAFTEWLDWTLELCAVGRCPFERPAFARLAGLAGRLNPPRRAQVEVLLGRLPEAEWLERQADGGLGEEWDMYWLLKAAELARQGKTRPAEAALARVPPPLHSRWQYSVLRKPSSAAPSERAVGPAKAQDPGNLWASDDGGFHREIIARGRPPALTIEIAEAPPERAVIAVAMDGYEAGWYIVRSGETVVVELPPSTVAASGERRDEGPCAHWVTVRPWAGGRVRLGQLTAGAG